MTAILRLASFTLPAPSNEDNHWIIGWSLLIGGLATMALGFIQ